MQTMVRARKAEESFFRASSTASLNSYRKTGKIPVGISALVRNGGVLDLIPLGSGLPSMDARIIHSALGFALRPLVEYVNKNKGAHPIALFLSVTGEGGVRHLDTGDSEEVHVIINAVRTVQNEGKTEVHKIVNNEFVRLPGNEEWSATWEENDLPNAVAQTMLDMAWREYIVQRNLSLIPNTRV